jgi:hypothetical protein
MKAEPRTSNCSKTNSNSIFHLLKTNFVVHHLRVVMCPWSAVEKLGAEKIDMKMQSSGGAFSSGRTTERFVTAVPWSWKNACFVD